MMKQDAPDSTQATLPVAPDVAETLYDEFQTLVRGGGGVAALIEAALPDGDPFAQLATLKSWLDAFRPLPPAIVEELRNFYTVSLTYHSNAIEGNTLTQNETEMVLSQGVTVGGKTLVEHLEVIGHRDAMAYMEELARLETPIGEREIKDLHSLILGPVDGTTGHSEAGRYRTLDVRAAGTGHIYPAHYRVPELMSAFATWLNAPAARALAPVEYASRAHFRFVSIHPFRDGNGRAGRLLMNLCLLRAGYPITVITNAQRADYINALIAGQSQPRQEGADAAGSEASGLTEIIAGACRASFEEYLRLLATAGDSRGRGSAFYRAVLIAHAQGNS